MSEQGLSAYERARQAAASVVARNDFNASDEAFIANNGRQARLRPPRGDEAAGKLPSLARLGFVPMILLVRRDGETSLTAVALLAITPAQADSLVIELARMGDEATTGLLDKPFVRWWPMET